MKVWELMAKLAELPAGAEVRVTEYDDCSATDYPLDRITDNTEDEAGSGVIAVLYGTRKEEE